MNFSLTKSGRRADLDEKLDLSLDSLVNDTYQKIEICRDFNRGECSRGRACPFRHQKVELNAEVCRDYNRGLCSRGDSCPYQHVKSSPNYVFTTDHQKPGNSSSSPELSSAYRAATQQICKDNLKGVCTRGDRCPFTHRTDYVEVCRDYIRGKCGRGGVCPFHHMVSLVNHSRLVEDAEICRDFQRGDCRRVPCPYLHIPEFVEVCRNFLDNKCRLGSRCTYHHPIIPQEDGNDIRRKRQRSSYDEEVREIGRDLGRDIGIGREFGREVGKTPSDLNRELLDQVRLVKEENQVLKEENILIRAENNRLREKLARYG